ncbi:MAG: Wzz/FepE/Etk N-terminal domain-containing protein [Acidobacteria bacterium]|nr:Wzz/FepE/Etk N-terminal domain-containing protein [Acidobacteriota bacterium]
MRQSTTKSAPEELEPITLEGEFPSDAEPQEQRLVPRLRTVWRRRRFIFRVSIWALLAALAVAFLLPNRYQATARLMPPDNQAASNLAMIAALSNRVGSIGALAGDFLGLKTSGALFIGMLRSQTLQDRLVERFDLQRVYGKDLVQNAREELADNSLISEDRKSGIITISVTDRDPHRAAAMARAHTEELNRLVTELSTSAARRERIFIEERLKAVQAELDVAAKLFGEFASQNIAIDIKEQGRAMVEAAAVLQGQMIAAESELQGLRQWFTENNVRVRAVRARIEELRRQLEKLGGTAASAAQSPSQSREATRGESLYPSIRRLPLLGVKYAELYRNAKIQETVFELLTQQYELAKVQEAKEIPTIKVLDVAGVPEKKSFPPRLLIAVLLTMLAFTAACVWVLTSAAWKEMDGEDAGRVLAKEVYGDLRASAVALTRNGNRPARVARTLWSRISGRKGEPGGNPREIQS